MIAGWRVLGIQASVDQTRERFGGKLNVRGRSCGAGSERDGVGFQVDGEAALRVGGGNGDGCRLCTLARSNDNIFRLSEEPPWRQPGPDRHNAGQNDEATAGRVQKFKRARVQKFPPPVLRGRAGWGFHERCRQ